MFVFTKEQDLVCLLVGLQYSHQSSSEFICELPHLLTEQCSDQSLSFSFWNEIGVAHILNKQDNSYFIENDKKMQTPVLCFKPCPQLG